MAKRFVVVEDTSTAGQWRGDILGSTKVAAHHEAAGLAHRLLSTKADFVADPDARLAPAVVTAAGPLPYLLAFDAAGKQLWEGAAPVASPEVFLKGLGGGIDEPRVLGYREPPEGTAHGGRRPNEHGSRGGRASAFRRGLPTARGSVRIAATRRSTEEVPS